MPSKRPPQTFKAAFEHCLRNQTGIQLTSNDVRPSEMRRDLDRTLRLGGFGGDEPAGNEALAALSAKQEKELPQLSDDLKGPDGLLTMVEKLGPINSNLSSEVFIKNFFKHLNMSQLNIVSFDEDIAKFTNLTTLDVSRNGINNISCISPNLKFLRIYNNRISQVTCVREESLCFLGAGYNCLAAPGMAQLSQRFRSLLSLDLCYNNLTSMRHFLDEVKMLDRLKHLCAAGNPLALQPHYRLILVRHLPQLQLLDEQAIGEAETLDAQLVDIGRPLEVPQFINVEITFTQMTYFKRLLLPLAKELPSTKLGDDMVEVPVSEEDRITQVAQNGTVFFRIELPGYGFDAPIALRLQLPGDSIGKDCTIDTTALPCEEAPVEEIPVKGAKGAPAEPPPKPPGEPLDLTSLKCFLNLPASAFEPPKEEPAAGEEAPAPPSTEAPLFFPLPMTTAEDQDGDDSMLQLRDWLRLGMKVKCLYRKNKQPVDPDAPVPEADEGEGEAAAPPPAEEEPRLIGGGVLQLSKALWPLIRPVTEEEKEDGRLPLLPPVHSIGPSALTLAPYDRWLEPDVQVPGAPSAKALSDVSAIVAMDVHLYAKEAPPEEDAPAA